MVVTRDGKNKVRDLIADALDYGELGTDGTDTDTGSSDLGAGETDTQATLTITKANQSITTRHVLLSTIGNGITYKEYGNFFADDVLFDRVVFPDYDKTVSNELITIEVFRIE